MTRRNLPMKFKFAVFVYRLCFVVALAFTVSASTAPLFDKPVNWSLLGWVAPLVILGRGALYFLGGL